MRFTYRNSYRVKTIREKFGASIILLTILLVDIFFIEQTYNILYNVHNIL